MTCEEVLAIRNRQLEAVHKIGGRIRMTLDLDERLKEILDVSLQTVNAVAGTIFLYRKNDDSLVFQYVVGPSAAELTGQAISSHDGVAGEVFHSGTPRITNRPRETPEHDAAVGEQVGFITESIVTIPLKYLAGKPVGVMQILNKQDGDFNDTDLEILDIIGAIAATAIENAQLYRDSQLTAVAHAVGDLSHDIKNKVTPIALSVMTLQPMLEEMFAELESISRDLPSHVADQLSHSVAGVRELYPETFEIISDQVQEVQDYTRLIADAVKGIVAEPQMEPHDLKHVLDKQLDSLELAARTRGLTLIREIQDVPNCRFDRNFIERAVYNLVNNAIPETPAGGSITVRAWGQPEGTFPNGGQFIVEVEDTGCGMPPQVLERILRGDAKSTKQGGTGLGTKIVFNAIAAHKGLFEGESRESNGTTFRMRIPLIAE